MAKRYCPFADYPRERKLYITSRMMDKELTNHMEEVYERTRKMLFDGALKKNNLDRNCNMVKLLPPIIDHEIRENEEQDDRPQILKGQCQLSFNGKLIPYEKATWKKEHKD